MGTKYRQKLIVGRSTNPVVDDDQSIKGALPPSGARPRQMLMLRSMIICLK
jgi:hypothetical protein